MTEKKNKTGTEGLDFYPGGAALISRDGEEKILAVNDKLCEYYQCPSQEAFLAFTGGFYRGMAYQGEYVPLEEVYRRRKDEEPDEFWFYHLAARTQNGHFLRLEGLLSPYEDERFGKAWSLHLIRSRFREGSLETDRVTGLLGRYAFYQKIFELAKHDRETGKFGRFIPVYINLTNFKMYNSNYGLEAGDELLRRLAACLRRYFPKSLMAHLSADNFVLLPEKEGLEEKLQALAADFRSYCEDPSVALKAGLRFFDKLGTKKPENHRQDFDLAKIAADSIKKDASRVYAVYTEEMGQKLADAAYVLRHFDEALEKKYIQVYYQPVVRTLTGKFCNVEALVRWQDPEKGLLSPARFIPVLEKAKLIPKLDFYVFEEAARLISFQKENARPVLPISVNLSRVDFDRADPVAQIEAIVERYQLPRSLFYIEITETALAQDSQRLQQAIQRFRQAGYQCWLDDFGSGYSSLNVLHRFRFDTIKLDMAFQKPFNDESRKILRSLVMMAKHLGIHTLAEGVETKEQVDFLRSIGCEKLQGYYYNKPLPYEECHRRCFEQDLLSETPAEALVMEKAGLVNIMTDTPLSVFLYDGCSKVTNLWENDAFCTTLKRVANVKAYTPGRVVNLKSLSVIRPFKGLLDRAVRTGREESMTHVDNGHYLKSRVQILAGAHGMYTGKLSLYDFMADESFQVMKQLDAAARYLLQIYDGLYLYHGREDEIEIISDLYTFGQKRERLSRREWMSLKARIHPDDRQRFLDWAAPRVLCRQAKASGRSLAVGMFRLRRDDGSYGWREFDALAVGRENEENLLFCVKDVPMDWIKDREVVLPSFIKSFGSSILPVEELTVRRDILIDVMKRSREIKFFWKDRKRRFLGASKAFLDYFGIRDEAAILGKTDEEMGWHVDDAPYWRIELKVLHQGLTSRRALGQCIVRGRLHTIRSSKAPLYDGNRIIGLIGYFEDLDQNGRLTKKDIELGLIDQETGLAGFRGMLMTGLAYFDNYARRGEDFLGLLFHVPELEGISQTYGHKVYLTLLQRVSRIIETFSPFSKTLSYLGKGKFCLFMKQRDSRNLQQRLRRLADDVHAVRGSRGRAVTLYLQYAVAYGSEVRNLDGLFHLLSERLETRETQKYGQSVYVGDRIVFNRAAFDACDQNVIMSRLDTYDVIYVNKAGLRSLNFPEDYDYSGMKCHQLLCGLDYPCDDCQQSLLRRDRFYTRTYHNQNLGRDYLLQHTLIPWHGQNCHLEVAIDLRHYMEDEIKENEFLFKEIAVNDAIESGLREVNPSAGIQNMLDRVGKILECERACIFEEMPDGTLRNTYEWCREGIPSMQTALQGLAKEEAQFIYDRFGTQQIAIIENVPKVLHKYGKPNPHMKDLKSLISGHLVIAGHSLGFTEIVNPSEKVRREASPLLATMTRFLAIMLRNRDTMQHLNCLSYADPMTGTYNRRAFLKYARNLPEDVDTAFIFGDMNGLKHINDHFGHDAGDRAICTAADIMRNIAGYGHVFRMGGDEFLMVVSDTDRKKTEDLIGRLKEKFDACGISMAFGASIQRTPIADIDKLISEADREMYRDKKQSRE